MKNRSRNKRIADNLSRKKSVKGKLKALEKKVQAVKNQLAGLDRVQMMS